MSKYLVDKRTNYQPYYYQFNTDEEKFQCLNFYQQCKNEFASNEQKFTKPLSDLGKALSQTISKLTRDKRFKRGDKVELILEIELVKSQTLNLSDQEPRHSIVEVTIIQHRLPEELPMVNGMQGDGPPRNVPYRLVPCASESDTPSTKRRMWFERVVYNRTTSPKRIAQNPATLCARTVEYSNVSEDTVQRNLRTGVAPKTKTKRKMRHGRKFLKYDHSSGSFHASKASRRVISESKERVTTIDRNTAQKNAGDVPAVDQLVNNILVGVFDKEPGTSLAVPNSAGRKTVYPPVYNQKVIRPRDARELKVNLSRGDAAVLNEDTHDWGFEFDTDIQKTLPDSYKNTVISRDQTNSDRSWVLKIEKNRKSYAKHGETKETICFGGNSMTIGSELKSKIETLIVNELQSLAVKEGIECDVSEMASQNELDYAVSEVKSFYCEVDLTQNVVKEVVTQTKPAVKSVAVQISSEAVESYHDAAKEAEKFEVTYFNPAARAWSKETDFSAADVSKVARSQTDGFVKQLQSDDTVWKNSNFGSDSNTLMIGYESSTMRNRTSDTTNEFSHIEIELDLKGLEDILEQARANGVSDKFLINASRSKKKEKACSENTYMNSASYTHTLLTKAAKKLEGYAEKRKKGKRGRKV